MSSITAFLTGRSTTQLAQDLLGHELQYHSAYGLTAGLIVETEAYLGAQDSASHAYRGHRSSANQALYQNPGTIYIHSQRGHYLLDIVVQVSGQPESILIRALQPTKGLAIMRELRQQTTTTNLTNGPAKLTQALGIMSRDLNQTSLSFKTLSLSNQRIKTPKIIKTSARINVSQRGNWAQKPLRFFVAGNPYVSNCRKKDCLFTSLGWNR